MSVTTIRANSAQLMDALDRVKCSLSEVQIKLRGKDFRALREAGIYGLPPSLQAHLCHVEYAQDSGDGVEKMLITINPLNESFSAKETAEKLNKLLESFRQIKQAREGKGKNTITRGQRRKMRRKVCRR